MASNLDPISEFREDHRKVRDGILEITRALKEKDVATARKILGTLNELTGPHFRYEEEYLYPALRGLLGEYVDQLYREHDQVVETAKVCAELLSKDEISDEEAEVAQKAAMALLVHVSNCDGLAILSERFTDEEIKDLGDRFADARDEKISLLEWADKIRQPHA
jgi:hemerythrin